MPDLTGFTLLELFETTDPALVTAMERVVADVRQRAAIDEDRGMCGLDTCGF